MHNTAQRALHKLFYHLICSSTSTLSAKQNIFVKNMFPNKKNIEELFLKQKFVLKCVWLFKNQIIVIGSCTRDNTNHYCFLNQIKDPKDCISPAPFITGIVQPKKKTKFREKLFWEFLLFVYLFVFVHINGIRWSPKHFFFLLLFFKTTYFVFNMKASYRFGTIWGWIHDGRIKNFW